MKLKMAFKIWLAIYPSITVFLYLFGDLMHGLELPVRTLILTLVLVPWVVFVGLPIVEKALKLFSGK